MRAIIPACGFGTRVGMLPNQSKELLLDSNDKPLILWHLDNCWREGIEPVVLIRSEKTDLIRYLNDKEVEVVIMPPGKEWAETIYNSKDHWSDLNILLLPDTRFEPLNSLKQVKESLLFGCETVFAVHKVNDINKWGFIVHDQFCEKPNYPDGIGGNAWGIIGFSKAAGKEIFKLMQNKNEFYYHTFDPNFIFLDKFEDLTRK